MGYNNHVAHKKELRHSSLLSTWTKESIRLLRLCSARRWSQTGTPKIQTETKQVMNLKKGHWSHQPDPSRLPQLGRNSVPIRVNQVPGQRVPGPRNHGLAWRDDRVHVHPPFKIAPPPIGRGKGKSTERIFRRGTPIRSYRQRAVHGGIVSTRGLE